MAGAGWELRRLGLSEFRVAVAFDDPACPVDAAVADRLRVVADALSDAGVALTEAKPGFDFGDSHRLFYPMLAAALAGDLPDGIYDRLEALSANGAETGELARLEAGLSEVAAAIAELRDRPRLGRRST